VGGMKYIVKDSETGFLVNKYDVTAIAEKITLLYDAKLRSDFGVKGYEIAINNYTEIKYIESIESLYKNLLKI
jgi:glycosyltransferase involved in cell wall biosynthesis